MTDARASVTVDATGLNCPLPLLKARKALATAALGCVVTILTTDPDSVPDLAALAREAGYGHRQSGPIAGTFIVEITKTAAPAGQREI